MGENLAFLTIDTGTIIGTLLNTVILFLILKHFLFKPVNKVINDRQAEVTATYEEADKKLENAKALEADYTEKLNLAKEESAEIVKSATKKAQTRSDEIIFTAKNEASSIMEKTNEDILREKKRAVNQIKDEISDIAMSIAEKVVSKEISAKDHERLIEDFIAGIGDDV